MNVRNHIKCLTCGEAHTVRVSLGHQSCQKHHVVCTKCNEIMFITIKLDHKNASWETVGYENCEFSDIDGAVVNVTPELAIPKEMLHADFIFPWMQILPKIVKPYLGRNPKGPVLIDMGDITHMFKFIHEEWNELRKTWSLYLNGKYKICNKIINEWNEKISQQERNDDIFCWIFSFNMRLMQPGFISNFNNLGDWVGSLNKSHFNQMQEFSKYLNDKLSKQHLKQIYGIYCDFMKNFEQFNQVLLYCRHNFPLDDSYVCSSIDFESVKMFYGNIYEVASDLLVVLACLNNIENGREYDKFESMTLNKYLKDVSKANRGNPFSDNNNGNFILKYMDSTLRNGSHHQSFHIDIASQVATYRAGGTGAENTITFTCYLELSVNLFLSLIAVFNIEIMLDYQYRSGPTS